MVMTMLMMLACAASWALVVLMLGDARDVLRAALDGRGHGSGWMSGSVPASLPSASFMPADGSRPLSSRAVRRR